MEQLATITRSARSTIKDVASLAGVTPGTVSLALNRNPSEIKLSLGTISRIQVAAKKLNYKPNLYAKRLVEGVDSHSTITVMTPITEGFGGWHNHQVLSAIVETAARHGMNVNLRNTLFDVKGKPITQSIGSPNLIDGVILHTWLDFPADVVEQLAAMGKPFVLANHYVDNPHVPCVGGDMFSAGKQIADHILSLGHRNIAAILGPATVCKVTSYLGGIRAALNAFGMDLPDSKVRFGNYESINRSGLYELMHISPRPTAIICINDSVALSAIGMLTEMGLSVPRDISVTGFGNASFSALMHPQLTTMDERGKTIGTEAMNILMAMMDDKPVDTKVNLTFNLIARETSAAPPSPNQ